MLTRMATSLVVVVVIVRITNRVTSTYEQWRLQPRETVAGRPPAWSVGSCWRHKTLFDICRIDTCRLLQGPTFCGSSEMVYLCLISSWQFESWLSDSGGHPHHLPLQLRWTQVDRKQRKQNIKLPTVGSRAFPVAAAPVWNGLPEAVISSSSLQTFWRQLKTHLFFNFRIHTWLSDCLSGIVTVVLVVTLLFRPL